MAGKTGPAQKVNPHCGCYVGGGYTGTFVGFAPADDPQLVVEVVLQKPQKGYYGGQVAAPVFKDVMSFALKQQSITNANSSGIGGGICVTVCPMDVLSFGRGKPTSDLIQIKRPAPQQPSSPVGVS